MALDLPVVTAEFHAMTRQIARCPHRTYCLSHCKKVNRADGDPIPILDPERPPSPDYLGRRYIRLAIVGANPGNASNGGQREHDNEMERLMRHLGEETEIAAFHELMAHLANSMKGWKQVVSAAHRKKLKYDIDEIAYLDIVKCKTLQGGSNPFSTVGPKVTRRCWETYTAQQLRLLQPTHVIGLWMPIKRVLRRLGYDVQSGEFRMPGAEVQPIQVVYGSYNGNWSLSADGRLEHATQVVDHFRKQRPLTGEENVGA